MEQHISKSAVVAEIEKLIDEIYAGRPFDSLSSEQQTALWYVKSIMSSVNTLKVREVDSKDEDFLKDYNQAIEDVCEYLQNNIDEGLVIYNKHTWCTRDEFINKLKKTMKK